MDVLLTLLLTILRIACSFTTPHLLRHEVSNTKDPDIHGHDVFTNVEHGIEANLDSIAKLGGRSLVASSSEKGVWSFGEALPSMFESMDLPSDNTESFQDWVRSFQNWTNMSSTLAALLPFLEMEHPSAIKPQREVSSFVVTSEDCQNVGSGHVFKGKRKNTLSKVIDVSMFGFDLDTYEVKLHELQNDIDMFFVIEAPWTHHGMPKPLIWERNKHKQRFAPFYNKISHVVVDHLPPNGQSTTSTPGSEISWSYEHGQETLGMEHVKDMLNNLFGNLGVQRGQILMNFGDADEIPLSRNVKLMRECEPYALPINNGVWMAVSGFTHAFKAGWPVDPSLPYTYNNPVYHDPMIEPEAGPSPASDLRFKNSTRYLLGGWHMTGYTYPPHALIKSLTATDYLAARISDAVVHEMREHLDKYVHDLDWVNKPSSAAQFVMISDLQKQEPYSNHLDLLELPHTVAHNPERFEAWFGKSDRRLRLPLL